MSLFWNHKWSGKCTRSDLRGSKNQKFSLSIILPPLVYFSKWNPGSHRVETNRRREINEMNRSNRKGSWVGGCISAWKLRRSDRHFCSCSCFRLSIHWTHVISLWPGNEKNWAHGRGAAVQPLGERKSWNSAEAFPQCCYAVCVLLLCRGPSGLVVTASDWYSKILGSNPSWSHNLMWILISISRYHCHTVLKF